MRLKTSDAVVAELRWMYDGRGLSTVQIAREKKCSPEWVRKLLQRSPGWKPRYMRKTRQPQPEPAEVDHV